MKPWRWKVWRRRRRATRRSTNCRRRRKFNCVSSAWRAPVRSSQFASGRIVCVLHSTKSLHDACHPWLSTDFCNGIHPKWLPAVKHIQKTRLKPKDCEALYVINPLTTKYLINTVWQTSIDCKYALAPSVTTTARAQLFPQLLWVTLHSTSTFYTMAPKKLKV